MQTRTRPRACAQCTPEGPSMQPQNAAPDPRKHGLSTHEKERQAAAAALAQLLAAACAYWRAQGGRHAQ